MESHQRQEERDNLNPEQSEENNDFDLRWGRNLSEIIKEQIIAY